MTNILIVKSAPMTREQHIAAGHKTVNLNTSGTRHFIEGWVDAAGNPV